VTGATRIPAQRCRERKRERDDAIGVDAHERCGTPIEGHRLHRPSDERALSQDAEPNDGQDRSQRNQKLLRVNARAQDGDRALDAW
jgi:hypothetical protein